MVELIYTLFLGLIALGLGRFLLRIMGVSRFSMAEELAFGLGLGLGAMALGVMALGLAHLLYAELFYLLLLAAGFVGAKELLGLRGRLSGRIWGEGGGSKPSTTRWGWARRSWCSSAWSAP